MSIRRFDPWKAIGKERPRRELTPLQAEWEAFMNRPPPGSDARRVIDLAHERMCRGLIAAARTPAR